MTEPQDPTWQLDPAQVIDVYAQSVRNLVAGTTKIGLRRAGSYMSQKYAEGVIPALEAQGERQARQADRTLRQADEVFRWQIRKVAEQTRLAVYGTPMDADTLRGTARPTDRWDTPPQGRIDPYWSHQLGARSKVLESTAAAIDDVLEGKRYWDEVFNSRSPGPGTLRRHPDAFDWLSTAIESAAGLAMPRDLDELHQAGRLQVAATAELLEAQRRLQDRTVPYADRSLLYNRHAEAGAVHVQAVDEALGRWVTEYVRRFDELAPQRLEEIVREAGLGEELDVTERQAEGKREQIRQANRAALREREAAEVPWRQQPVPVAAYAKPGAAPAREDRDPTAKPSSGQVADVPRNATEIRVPTAEDTARMHPWIDLAATYGLPRPPVRAAGMGGTAPAPTHLPAAGAGLPDAGKQPRAAATSALPYAAERAAAAANTRPAGGPQDITVPLKGAIQELAVARER